MSDTAAAKYNATVVGREQVNAQLITLRVRSDGDLFKFEPGQFAVLGLGAESPRVPEADPEDEPPPAGKLIRRAYSIASASVERDYVEFHLTLVRSGELTPRLFALKHGDRLFLSPKASGMFTLDRADPEKNIALVATGTGLAPYMSMLRTILIHDAKRKFVVLHGARHSWDLGYRAELESLSRLRPNFTYLPSITRPSEDPHFEGLTGRVQQLIERVVVEEVAGIELEPDQSEVFLCGNPAMVEAVLGLLEQRGYVRSRGKNPGTVHVEEYW